MQIKFIFKFKLDFPVLSKNKKQKIIQIRNKQKGKLKQ